MHGTIFPVTQDAKQMHNGPVHASDCERKKEPQVHEHEPSDRHGATPSQARVTPSARPDPRTTRRLDSPANEAPPSQNTPRRSWRDLWKQLALLWTFLVAAIAILANAAQLAPWFSGLFGPPTVYAAGSNTILDPELGLDAAWAQGLAAQHNGLRPDFQATGTVAGIARTAELARQHGAAVLFASEPLLPAQLTELAPLGSDVSCWAVFGWDVIGVVTNLDTPLRALRVEQLAQILSGELTRWNEVDSRLPDQPITVLRRDEGGTWELLTRRLSVDPEPPAGVNVRSCSTNGECIDRLISTSGGIYFLSRAWLSEREELRNVHPVSIAASGATLDPFQPTFGSAEDLAVYPQVLIRPLLIYLVAEGDRDQAPARLLFEYVRGSDGQNRLADQGFYRYPGFRPPPDSQPSPPPGFEAVNPPYGGCR